MHTRITHCSYLIGFIPHACLDDLASGDPFLHNFQHVPNIYFLSNTLVHTAGLVTLCAKGNNAACDKLAANPSVIGALQHLDAKNPSGFAARHPKAARSMWHARQAHTQGLFEMHRQQGLYMGDHWGIEGIDSMPADTSSGNSLFDFGVMDGTPRDPQTGMPLPGTLDTKVRVSFGEQSGSGPKGFAVTQIIACACTNMHTH